MKKTMLRQGIVLIAALTLISNQVTLASASEIGDATSSSESAPVIDLNAQAQAATVRDFPQYNQDAYQIKINVNGAGDLVYIYITDLNGKFVADIEYSPATDSTQLIDDLTTIVATAEEFIANHEGFDPNTYQLIGKLDETGTSVIVDIVDETGLPIHQYWYDIESRMINLDPINNNVPAVLADAQTFPELVTEYTAPAEIQGYWMSQVPDLEDMIIKDNTIEYGSYDVNILKIESEEKEPNLITYYVYVDAEEYLNRTGQALPYTKAFEFTYDRLAYNIVNYSYVESDADAWKGYYDERFTQVPQELIGNWEPTNTDLEAVKFTNNELYYGSEKYIITEVFTKDLGDGLTQYYLSWDVNEYQSRTNTQVPGLQLFEFTYDNVAHNLLNYVNVDSEKAKLADPNNNWDNHYYQSPLEIQGTWVSGDKNLPKMVIEAGFFHYGDQTFQVQDVYSENLGNDRISYNIAWNVEEYQARTGQSVPGPHMFQFVYNRKDQVIENYQPENVMIQRALQRFEDKFPQFNQDYHVSQVSVNDAGTLVVIQVIDVNGKYYGTFHYDMATNTIKVIEDATSTTETSQEETTKQEAKKVLPATGESQNSLTLILASVVLLLGVAILAPSLLKQFKKMR